MTEASVSVVGSSGRVGSALVDHLVREHTVAAIARLPGEAPEALAARAASSGRVIVNAAGVAHIDYETPSEIARLREGNVDLPLALAAAALEQSRSLIHISSVKATADAETAYGRSKFEGDRRLEGRCGPEFARAGLHLVIVRPLALLFPPFDAGKMSRLGALRRVPRAIVPAVRVPALAPATFLTAVADLVERALANGSGGLSYREFADTERCTLRELRDAMLSADEPGRNS